MFQLRDRCCHFSALNYGWKMTWHPALSASDREGVTLEKVFTSFPLNRGSLTRKGRTEKELDSCDIDRKSAALHCSMLIFWQIFNVEIKAQRLSKRQPSDSFCWPLCGAGTFTLERRYWQPPKDTSAICCPLHAHAAHTNEDSISTQTWHEIKQKAPKWTNKEIFYGN